jgi:hypothetical protein
MNAYRDQYAQIFGTDGQVVLLSISVDPVDTLAAWAKDADYPFTFLSDPNGEVGKLYGAYIERNGSVVDNRMSGHAQQLKGKLPQDRQVGRRERERRAGAAVSQRCSDARVRLGHPRFAHQHLRNLVLREPAKPDAHAAGPHRGQQRAEHGGRQDEHRAGRRLFERLQQRVLRLRLERVGLADDNHPLTALERAVADAIEHVAHHVGLDRRLVIGLEHGDIHVQSARDAIARPAAPARVERQRVRGDRLEKVDHLRQRPGDDELADA